MRKLISMVAIIALVALAVITCWALFSLFKGVKIEKRQYEDPSKRFEKIAEKKYYKRNL